jgi:hypothetical protein
MEPLWSPAGATGGSPWQVEVSRKRLRQAKTVAVGCHRLPETFMVRRGSAVRVRQRASRKALQMGICCCLLRRNVRASRVRDGYILGLAGTRGHARRLAAQPETCSRHSIASTHPKTSCKAEAGVACSDAMLTPSFAREEVIGIPTTPDLEGQPFRPPEVRACDPRRSRSYTPASASAHGTRMCVQAWRCAVAFDALPRAVAVR